MKRRNAVGATQKVSVIEYGAQVVGDVRAAGVVRVAGSVVGNVRAGRQVVVVKGGMIEGDIEAPEAIIGGEARGPVRATQRVTVQASAVLYGTISTPRLAVEEGATLDVELCMCESGTLSDRSSDFPELPADGGVTDDVERTEGLRPVFQSLRRRTHPTPQLPDRERRP